MLSLRILLPVILLMACSPSDLASLGDAAVGSVDAAVEPADAAVEPADAAVEPADAAVEPADATVEPADATVEPADAAVEPADAAVEPTVVDLGMEPGPEIAPVGFGALEFPEPEVVPFTPLGKLTNQEFLASVIALMEMDVAQSERLIAEAILPAEATYEGLASDSYSQLMTQFAMEQLGGAVDLAVSIKMGAGVTVETFNDALGCPDPLVSQELCIVELARSRMVAGFRGAVTEGDLDRIDALMATVDEIFAASAPVDGEISDELHLAQLNIRLMSAMRLILLDPKFQFLYETGVQAEELAGVRPLTTMEIANRLSYFATGGPPDADLLAATEWGLESGLSRVVQIDRLMASESSVSSIVSVLSSWLAISDEKASPEAVSAVRAFLTTWVRERRPLAELYTAPVMVNHLDGTQSMENFGVLGLQAFVASHTSNPTPSFINRGEFLFQSMLCGELPTDIPDAAAVEVESALEVFEQHARSPCATCHQLFDNYGAAFQRFDVETSLYMPENDWLGDAFELFPLGDVEGVVSDAGDLGQVVGASRQAALCLAKLWVRHALRRKLADDGEDQATLEAIVDAWLQTDVSVTSLFELVVSQDAFKRISR